MHIDGRTIGWACAVAVLCLGLTPAPARAQVALRAGDVINLRLSGVSDAEEIAQVSQAYQIDDSGMVNLPYIGRMQAAGMSPGALQTSIQKRYRDMEIYSNPTITIVMEPGTRFVTVGGEVKLPQRVSYTPDLTLYGAIQAAGGFSPYANQKKVLLLRGESQSPHNIKDILAGKAPDPKLQPGDRVEVRQSFF